MPLGEIRYPEDERLILIQLDTNDVPAEVIPEYNDMLLKIHRSGGQGPLGHIVVAFILSKLNLKTQPKASDAKIINDWNSVKKGTKVVVKDPSLSKIAELGEFIKSYGNGILSIDFKHLDPKRRQIYARYVSLDLPNNLPKRGIINDGDWTRVATGTAVNVKLENKVIDGVFVGLTPSKEDAVVLVTEDDEPKEEIYSVKQISLAPK